MRIKLGCLSILVALSGSACVMEVGEAGTDGVYEDEVAVSASALSNVTTIGDLTFPLRGLGNAFALFQNPACAWPALVFLNYSDSQAFVGNACIAISAFVSDRDDDFYFFDAGNRDIYRYDTFTGAVTKLRDTVGSISGPLGLSSTHVFWADDTGVHRVSRTGGGYGTLLGDAFLTLRGVHGSTVFFSDKDPYNDDHTLKRVPAHGGPTTTMLTYSSRRGFEGFSVDSSAAYWTDNTGNTKRIRRFSRALGGGMTTVVSSATDFFYLPTPTANGLHFVQKSFQGVGVVKIRRSLDGVITDQYQTGVEITDMRATSTTRLRWAEEWPDFTRIRSATL